MLLNVTWHDVSLIHDKCYYNKYINTVYNCIYTVINVELCDILWFKNNA